MGMLGNQPPRDYCRKGFQSLDDFLSEAILLAKDRDVSVSEVIAAKHALELERQNDMAREDGDFRDEQMGGFGDLISKVADALQDIASALRDHRSEDN
jgi:hypothetical protein